MPGDYSRKTFDGTKHYSGVLMQQGRVQLDADWNEQLAIQLNRTETEAKDVIGPCGVPIGTGGFQITPTTNGLDLSIAPGRIYAGGLLCELEPGTVETTYTTQPHYPNPEHVPPSSPPAGGQIDLDPGTYLVYLDAWRQEITALDDPRIREVALGGPDTGARLKTVWQVRLLSTDAAGPSSLTCDADLDAILPAPSGRMNARTVISTTDDPCELPPASGYRRLENQLYRVEIHRSGDLSQARFKWSRDNATVETKIEAVDGTNLIVADVGKDDVLGFAGGQWVEIVDEESELNRHTFYRQLYEIASVNPGTRTITLTPPVSGLAGRTNLKLRRWDQSGAQAAIDGIPLSSSWIALEGGIEVTFAPGSYRAGDYWLVPARTATTEIEWPPFEVPNVNPITQPPYGVVHHYCHLAILTVTPSGLFVEDCRNEFPPLTQMIQLHYVSGDGQEGQPGQQLSQPFQVGVVNGTFPIAEERVRFRTILGSGTLLSPAQTGPDIVVRTGSDGVAECRLQMDASTTTQRVEAMLETHDTLPVRFNASFADTGGGFVETFPTNLLFTFVTWFPQSGFDTGIVIANTNASPFLSTGFPPQAGTITFFFYTCAQGSPTLTTYTTNSTTPGLGGGLVQPGCSFIINLSQLLIAANFGGTSFTGYMIASCNFAGAYGYAQINQNAAGAASASSGYLAIVLPRIRSQMPGPATLSVASTPIGRGRITGRAERAGDITLSVLQGTTIAGFIIVSYGRLVTSTVDQIRLSGELVGSPGTVTLADPSTVIVPIAGGRTSGTLTISGIRLDLVGGTGGTAMVVANLTTPPGTNLIAAGQNTAVVIGSILSALQTPSATPVNVGPGQQGQTTLSMTEAFIDTWTTQAQEGGSWPATNGVQFRVQILRLPQGDVLDVSIGSGTTPSPVVTIRESTSAGGQSIRLTGTGAVIGFTLLLQQTQLTVIETIVLLFTLRRVSAGTAGSVQATILMAPTDTTSMPRFIEQQLPAVTIFNLSAG